MGRFVTRLKTADNVEVTSDSSTNSTFYPTFVNGTSGEQDITLDSQMTYNPSTGELTAQVVTASSDAEVKDRIRSLEGSLEKVSRLSGKQYVRKATGLDEIGLVAQEVEEVIPEVVYTSNSGLKSIAYGNIVSLLIEAIKEQNVRIDDLERKLNDK